MPKTRTGTTPAVAAVIRAIADDKSLALFRIIARSNGIDSGSLKGEARLTRKQYYSKLSRMTRSGLVRRRRGKYILTTFGKVVYLAQTTVETGLENSSNLKAIDSIELSNELPKEEHQKVTDTLLDNEKLRDILDKNHVDSEAE